MYFVKTPFWVKKIFDTYTWKVATREKKLYLTFDDGPHPVATPSVLRELDRFEAKATFFCLGKNVLQYPDIYNKILENGHTAGNHTHNHLNGWKTPLPAYIHNVEEASKLIASDLFRPPYGRITAKQGKALRNKGYQVIMWEVLSGDFDVQLPPEKCLDNVTKKAAAGSIIVFHDSEKAYKNLSFALPKVLEYFSERGFHFEGLKNGRAKI